MVDRQIDTLTDRYTRKWIDRQMDTGWIDRYIGGYIDRQIGGWMDKYRQIDRLISVQVDRYVDRQMDKQMDGR